MNAASVGRNFGSFVLELETLVAVRGAAGQSETCEFASRVLS